MAERAFGTPSARARGGAGRLCSSRALLGSLEPEGRRPTKVVPVTKAPSTSLLERLRDPGFTPRLGEVDGLVDLLVDDDLGKAAVRAIRRVGPAALEPLLARMAEARAPLRAHVVKAIGRLAPEPGAVRALLAALGDADPKSRRNAAIALGHVGRPDVEDALLAAWDRDPARRCAGQSRRRSARPGLRARCLSCAKPLARTTRSSLGSPVALGPSSNAPRPAARAAASTSSRSPRRPVALLALARRGLEDLLAEELRDVAAVVDVRADGPGRVRARLAGSIDALFAARTMLSFQFVLPPEPRRDGEAPARHARPRRRERIGASNLRHLDGGRRPLSDRLVGGWPPARRDLGRVARHSSPRPQARRRSDRVDLGARRLAWGSRDFDQKRHGPIGASLEQAGAAGIDFEQDSFRRRSTRSRHDGRPRSRGFFRRPSSAAPR